MDFSYSEEQEALRQLARRLLGERFTDEHRKNFRRSGAAYDAALWEKLARAGILGTAIAVEHGGSGLGLTELGLLLEEQGAALAAVPLLATLVLGALPVQQFGNAAQRTLLRAVAGGTTLFSAALEECGGEVSAPQTRATPHEGGWRLEGSKSCVPYGSEAQYLIVSATTAGGPRLFFVERATPGLTMTPQHSSSGEPQAQLDLAAVRLPGAALLGGAEALPWLLARARIALAALQVGIIGEALRRAAAYVSERRQFGRPLGTFQAVQHRLADAFIDLEALRSVYWQGVSSVDCGEPAEAAALTAKWWAAEAGHRVTHSVQHLHGGLGADVEYPVHAYFLWAKQVELALGAAAPLLAAFGTRLAAGAVTPLTLE